VCPDSRAEIAAPAETTTESPMLWENMQALDKFSGSSKLTLVWIPRHHGIPGNEESDKLALTKEGAWSLF
jgi:ribonuclease HI